MILLCATVFVFVAILVFMPKRLSWLEIYATGWFAITFAYTADVYLDLRLHLYGYFNYGQPDWRTLIIRFGLFPTFNAIFLNFFPILSKWKQTQYIIGTTMFLVFYEWLFIKTGVFYHSGWKLWYSALAYPVVLLILYWNWKITKRLIAMLRSD